MNDKQITKLTAKYQTPMYIFDISILHKRLNFLRQHLPSDVALCYAVKANTFILKEMIELVDRFEVCSPGEFNICQKLQIPPENIVVSGVYKTPAFIVDLITKQSLIGIYTIESMQQFDLIKKVAKSTNSRVSILIRLTSGNQFGINEQDIKKIIKDNKDNPHLDIRGIQYFSNTQKNSIKRLSREITYLDSFIEEISNQYNFEVRELEYGPGFPVSYFLSDTFDEETFLVEFSDLLLKVNSKIKITLELGRSIAASCGNYLTKIVDIKTNKNHNYAIVDGGIHQIVYYGQSMAMKHPIHYLFPQRDVGEVKEWNLCGSLCTINDILVKQLPLQNLKIGDIVVFENTGAYCMTEGISLFLSRDLPKVILKKEDGSYICIRDGIPTDVINTPNYEKE